MRTFKYIATLLIGLTLAQGCGIYSFSGTSISPDIKTFQVNFFQNLAPIVIPGIDQTFTNQLQDLILNQTNLNLTTSNGDIIYEGEIIKYYVAPTTATSSNTAAQNRLTVTVNTRFYDTKDPKQDLEKQFSFFFDYPASVSENSIRNEALEVIYKRIAQDIFSDTLAKW